MEAHMLYWSRTAGVGRAESRMAMQFPRILIHAVEYPPTPTPTAIQRTGYLSGNSEILDGCIKKAD
jgi:hypothetical protein